MAVELLRRQGSISFVGGGSKVPWTINFADRLAVPRPFDTFVNATEGPYVPGDRLEALALTVSVMVMPFVSVDPAVELAVSQEGVRIE